jgi:hypothetical protein
MTDVPLSGRYDSKRIKKTSLWRRSGQRNSAGVSLLTSSTLGTAKTPAQPELDSSPRFELESNGPSSEHASGSVPAEAGRTVSMPPQSRAQGSDGIARSDGIPKILRLGYQSGITSPQDLRATLEATDHERGSQVYVGSWSELCRPPPTA